MLNLVSITGKSGRPGRGRPGMGWRPALALALGLGAFWLSASARAEKGAMELGLSGRWAWPQQDAGDFDPGLGYGFIFHYWLTRTTSIEAAYDYLQFQGPLPVDGEDKGQTYTASVIEAGVRYRPPVDFLLKPYVEGGAAYQFWEIKPGLSALEGISGANFAAFAGAGAEYEVLPTVTLGVGCRYLYLPMQTHLDHEVRTLAPGKYAIREVPFENVGIVSAGVELTWRFR